MMMPESGNTATSMPPEQAKAIGYRRRDAEAKMERTRIEDQEFGANRIS